jgi:hypothetical protein
VSGWDPNHRPPPDPIRSKAQRYQNFGWLNNTGVLGRGKLRGEGPEVQIGDHSPIGARLFENVAFTTGQQGRPGRGMRRFD